MRPTSLVRRGGGIRSAFRTACSTACVGCLSIPACRNGLISTSRFRRANLCTDTFIAPNLPRLSNSKVSSPSFPCSLGPSFPALLTSDPCPSVSSVARIPKYSAKLRKKRPKTHFLLSTVELVKADLQKTAELVKDNADQFTSNAQIVAPPQPFLAKIVSHPQSEKSVRVKSAPRNSPSKMKPRAPTKRSSSVR